MKDRSGRFFPYNLVMPMYTPHTEGRAGSRRHLRHIVPALRPILLGRPCCFTEEGA
jgi:hypothetical protein